MKRKLLRMFSPFFAILLLFTTGLANDQGFVLDKAGVLSEAEESELQSYLANYEKQSRVEMVVLTIPSLNGEDIYDYSMRVSHDLGIGKADVNNGALILLAIKDKSVRINLGYGLEWAVGDRQAEKIIQEMLPALKTGNYMQALHTGFGRLKYLTEPYSRDIREKSIDWVSSRDIGKVFSFKAKYIGAKKLPTGTVTVIETEDHQTIQLNTTVHMSRLVGILKTKRNVWVTGRLVHYKPIVMDLMGVR
ncbi:MAG TPA: TPM domain-containing protein [Bacillota bacterium]|nr:TPM domain-containing protein [Bacillota bacterium]